MNNGIFKIIIISVVIGIGCKKSEWYDVKSNKQLTIPSTIRDLQALLDNGGLFNSISPYMHEMASDDSYIRDEALMSMSANEFNCYTWSKEKPYIKVLEWLSGKYGSYRRIYTANLILETSDKITPETVPDTDALNSVKGQALFSRGYTFFGLSQIFSPPYHSEVLDLRLGIPLRVESDIEVKSERSTVREMYERIIDDLEQAYYLLPQFQPYKTRPTKAAALAMLARVYLSMENYQQAGYYSGLALELRGDLLNYNVLDLQTASCPFAPYNEEVIYHNSFSGGNYFYSYEININKDLYNLYGEMDLRKKAFFNFNQSSGTISYKGSYASEGFDFFGGLAIDELYLIRAECFARDGKIAQALNDLNTLLKTRSTNPYVDLIAATADEALILVLRERRKELVLRGTRWSDLRRLNRDSRFAQTFTRIVNGKTYTLEPNSYKYTFPIPDDIIEATGIEQNPAWK